MNVGPSPSRAINGRHALPPVASVSRTTAAASAAEPSRGSMFSAASRTGCTSRWYSGPEHSMHSPTARRPSTRAAAPNADIRRAGARDPAARIENPPRQAVADPQPPALAGRQIDERKLRRLRPDQVRCAADRLGEVQHRMIARQHQVVAVVDGHADGAVEIGPAAAARIGGGLVHDDIERRRRQLHRRCKARQACADNVDGASHQMIAY